MSQIKLSKDQEAAAAGFQQFLRDTSIPDMLITGAAGTGKTFLTKYLIDLFHTHHQFMKNLDPNHKVPRLYLTATTHKAANVLAEATDAAANTIHSLLNLKVLSYSGKDKLQPKGSLAFRQHSVVFVDEASMVGAELLGYIRDAQKKYGLRFVFIGDKYQLSPVKEAPSAVFFNTAHSFELLEIQRQAAGSPIIQLAHKHREVLDDPTLEWPDIAASQPVIHHYDDHDDFKAVMSAHMSNIAQQGFHENKVLSWTNSASRGYNAHLRKINGFTHDFEMDEIVITNKPIMQNGSNSAVLAPSDTVLRITDIQEETDGATGLPGYKMFLAHNRRHSPIFQSLAGFQPKDWNTAYKLQKDAYKRKDWPLYYHIKHMLDLRAQFAITCHKAQGSTYDNVFINLDDISRCNIWEDVARLTYVGLTRARHSLHIYGRLRNRYPSKQPRMGMEVFQ